MLNPDNATLEWCAKWIEGSLRGETNERTIEFGRNMAMTIRAAALPDTRVRADVGTGEARWLPIETAPKGRSAFMVYCSESGDIFQSYRFEDDEQFRMFNSGGRIIHQSPSHWMPMPPPPDVAVWCSHGKHDFGEWQPASIPWKWERFCKECGFAEKSNAESGVEFRPQASPTVAGPTEDAGRARCVHCDPAFKPEFDREDWPDWCYCRCHAAVPTPSTPDSVRGVARDSVEREFLNASIAVWREIDRLSVLPGGYKGLPPETDPRKRELAAWEAYRAELDSGAEPREDVEDEIEVTLEQLTGDDINRFSLTPFEVHLEEERQALAEALRPFAAMHREGSDTDEIACVRGTGFDKTIITSGDFERAWKALKEPLPATWQSVGERCVECGHSKGVDEKGEALPPWCDDCDEHHEVGVHTAKSAGEGIVGEGE